MHALAPLCALLLGKPPSTAFSWAGLVTAAFTHELAPMLWWALQQQPDLTVPPELLRRLSDAAEQSFLHHLLLYQTLTSVDAALRAVRLTPIWLKGIALAHQLYPHAWLRPMRDLDVIVPLDQRELAYTTLLSAGYENIQDLTMWGHVIDTTVHPPTHHYELAKSGTTITLELHYHLLGIHPNLLPTNHLQRWLSQTTIISADDLHFTILSTEIHLLYLVAHMLLQHGEAHITLRHYWDLHLLLTRQPLDWDRLLTETAALQWAAVLDRALTQTARYFDTPIPPFVFDRLRVMPTSRPILQRMQRLASTSAAFWTTMPGLLSQLRQLPMLQRLHLLVAAFVPTRAYMMQRYGLQRRRQLWLAYPYRWLSHAATAARWLFNAIRGKLS